MRSTLVTSVVCLVAAFGTACSDDGRRADSDGGGTAWLDAGVSTDAGSTGTDAGARTDAGGPVDAGRDSGFMGYDAGPPYDGGPFMGRDAGPGYDAGPPLENSVGETCRGDYDCVDPEGGSCYESLLGTTLRGGYCTSSCLTPGAADGCGTEGTCVQIVPASGSAVNLCALGCDSDEDCRTDEGYHCGSIPAEGSTEGTFCVPTDI